MECVAVCRAAWIISIAQEARQLGAPSPCPTTAASHERKPMNLRCSAQFCLPIQSGGPRRSHRLEPAHMRQLAELALPARRGRFRVNALGGGGAWPYVSSLESAAALAHWDMLGVAHGSVAAFARQSARRMRSRPTRPVGIWRPIVELRIQACATMDQGVSCHGRSGSPA